MFVTEGDTTHDSRVVETGTERGSSRLHLRLSKNSGVLANELWETNGACELAFATDGEDDGAQLPLRAGKTKAFLGILSPASPDNKKGGKATMPDHLFFHLYAAVFIILIGFILIEVRRLRRHADKK